MKLKKLTTDDYLSVVENYRMFDIKSNCVDFGIEEMRERIRRYYHDFFVTKPASRKARATTLAPRSCPSRPGLATKTRIFIYNTPQ